MCRHWWHWSREDEAYMQPSMWNPVSTVTADANPCSYCLGHWSIQKELSGLLHSGGNAILLFCLYFSHYPELLSSISCLKRRSMYWSYIGQKSIFQVKESDKQSVKRTVEKWMLYFMYHEICLCKKAISCPTCVRTFVKYLLGTLWLSEEVSSHSKRK